MGNAFASIILKSSSTFTMLNQMEKEACYM
jgi:hypothetical protein